MKKILLIALLLLSVKGFAQISLEYTYNITIALQQVSATEWDYVHYGTSHYPIVSAPDTVDIYSINHSFTESFIIPCPSNKGVYSATYLSKNLFSTSGKFDMVCNYVDTGSSPSPIDLSIIQDDGAILLTVDSATVIDIYNTTSGAKLLLNKERSNGASSTQVYSLPGSDAGIPRAQADIMVNNAYPNPTANLIHLPYNLNGNAQGELDVVNMQGQLVKQFKIGNAFNDILLNAGDLPRGDYLYYIITNGQQSQAKQFVVQ